MIRIRIQGGRAYGNMCVCVDIHIIRLLVRVSRDEENIFYTSYYIGIIFPCALLGASKLLGF